MEDMRYDHWDSIFPLIFPCDVLPLSAQLHTSIYLAGAPTLLSVSFTLRFQLRSLLPDLANHLSNNAHVVSITTKTRDLEYRITEVNRGGSKANGLFYRQENK
jgi:hypothetical protein